MNKEFSFDNIFNSKKEYEDLVDTENKNNTENFKDLRDTIIKDIKLKYPTLTYKEFLKEFCIYLIPKNEEEVKVLLDSNGSPSKFNTNLNLENNSKLKKENLEDYLIQEFKIKLG